MYLHDPVQENKEIVRLYRALMRAWRSNKGIRDKHRVREAFEMAKEAHSTQRRASGEPYIYHPLEVARIAAGNIGLGETAIICSLLHDVVEDNPEVNYREIIREKFGEKVYSIVDGLTKIKDGYVTTESSAQAENIKKMLLTLSDDVRVILIKLADRLHNMRTLDSMPDRKRKNIAGETLYLYAPLAHRLGLYAVKSELEDLALKYTDPEVYYTIARKLHETEPSRLRFIQKFIYPIKKSLAAKGYNFEIDSREKSIYSIYKKMQSKEIPFEEVYDIFAIRIIIDVPADQEKIACWDVYTTVTDFYNPKLNRLRDWISTPKSNGYESLHTTVMSHSGQFVEVQVRTRRMHEIAERGFAAHWKYKQLSEKEHSTVSGLEQWLIKVREILSSPDSNALTLLDDIKLALYAEEVYVFTPKGHLRSLPARSTVIDFAYSIHSALGNTCIAAKVNRKLVPLNYQLRSGDQVEIISSKKGMPKEEWLEYVTTPRAKSYIKEALKEQRKVLSDQGRKMLEQYFRDLGLRFNRKNLLQFMGYFSIKSHIDLYYKVASGKISPDHVRECCVNHKSRAEEQAAVSTVEGAETPETGSGHVELIRLAKTGEAPDLDDVPKVLARCCHPLPGDDVVTHTPVNGVYEVHRTNCPRAIELMSRFSNQLIHWKWSNRQLHNFVTGLKIVGIDRRGMLLDIIRVISEQLNFNISSVHIDSSGEVFECFIVLRLHDVVDMVKLSEEMKKIQGITSATRLNTFAED